jgi:hypothetical protein
MKFTILEIFFIFWLSAFLWILVEYVYQRINKKEKQGMNTDSYEQDRKSDSFAA